MQKKADESEKRKSERQRPTLLGQADLQDAHRCTQVLDAFGFCIRIGYFRRPYSIQMNTANFGYFAILVATQKRLHLLQRQSFLPESRRSRAPAIAANTKVANARCQVMR
jgi:hypothetical protein